MINPIQHGNMTLGPGSLWTQFQQGYNQQQNATAYQQALHGLSPAIQGVFVTKWMFDGVPMSVTEFADNVFQDDDPAKSLFLLKYSK